MSDVLLLVEMSIVNKPEISKLLVWLYVGIAIFIPVLGVIVIYFPSLQTPATREIAAVVLIVAFGFVESVMLWIVASIYRTKYILTGSELVLKAPRLIGGNKRIPLKTIESIERTLIPFGFRLFGASFYGGYYYFPSVGKAFMVITNFRDGVLIKAKHGNYVITPRNPEGFIETIENIKSQVMTKN